MDIECGSDGCEDILADCQPIPIEAEDPDFTSQQCLEFVRSQDVPNLNCTMGLYAPTSTIPILLNSPVYKFEATESCIISYAIANVLQ